MSKVAVRKASTLTPHQWRTAESGIAASFIKLTPTWGVKFFSSGKRRDENAHRQRQAAAIGLAPRVGDNVDIPNDYGFMRYGFITERATVAFDFIAPKIKIRKGVSFNRMTETERSRVWAAISWNYDNFNKFPDIRAKFNDLNNKIAAVQNTVLRSNLCIDLHVWNWGLLKSGEPVIIDFSEWDT